MTKDKELLSSLAPLVEVNMVLAMALLWVVFAIALSVVGWDTLIAVLVSFLATVLSGALCVAVERDRSVEFKRPESVFSFCGFGLALSGLSLVADCVVGSLRDSGVPLSVACTEKAGIGFGITALLLLTTGGITLVALLRLFVRRVRKHL